MLGAAVPRELGGGARLCIRELTMRPIQGRPKMRPRSLGKLLALWQNGSCLNWVLNGGSRCQT